MSFKCTPHAQNRVLKSMCTLIRIITVCCSRYERHVAGSTSSKGMKEIYTL